jgi:hypothetical protein
LASAAFGDGKEHSTVIYFLDTEFNGFGGDLISLALAPADERYEPLYLALEIVPDPEPFVVEHVLPVLHAGPVPPQLLPHRGTFGPVIAAYLASGPREMPVIVADWPDDIRLFCQALTLGNGQMVRLPPIRFDLRPDLAPSPPLANGVPHNALCDALALRAHALATGRSG